MANSAENSAHLSEATTRTEFEKNIGKEYFKEAAWPMAGYVVTILLLTTLVDLETAGAWKYLVVLIPVIPMLFFLRAVIRQFGRMDEMQRGAQLEALALSFGVTIFAAITLGFLSIAGLNTDPWGPWVIFSVGMATWLAEILRRGLHRP